MSEPSLIVDREHPGITVLTLNRPSKRNALTIELLKSIYQAMQDSIRLPGQRVIILQGAGAAFCTGLDLEEAQDLDRAHEMAEAMASVLASLSGSPLVTIAAVHGSCVAGGAGIMSACDIAVAAEGTHIGYPETRRGLVAGLVMTFLTRILSDRHVRELLLTGELITAQRAYEIGLLNRLVETDKVLATALELASSVIKGAPGATAHTKRLLMAMSPRTVNQDIQTAMDEHMIARRSMEASEGIRAFFEKRKPHWETMSIK